MYGEKPPDHPLGYLVAFGAFLVQFSVFGAVNSYTIFLESMANDETLGFPSQTELSLGNSISTGLTPAVGIIAGYLSDRVHPRVMAYVSLVALLAGLLLSSFFAKTGLQLSLFFAIPISFGAGMMLTPTTAATATWFDKHRGTAIGIVFAGGGMGSVIYPLFCGPLLTRYGWRMTFRFLTALIGPGLIGAVLVEKRADSSSSLEEESNETTALALTESTFHNTQLKPVEMLRFITTPLFILFFVCQIFYSFAFFSSLYVPVPLALAMGKEGTVYEGRLPINNESATRIMTWYGIAQTIGSLSSGFVSSYLGCEAVFCLCCSIVAIAFNFLALSRNYAGISVSVAVIALSASGMLSTFPTVVAKVYHGANLGTSLSLIFLAGCITGLSAPPLLSTMQSSLNGDYTYGCILSSGFSVAAAYTCYFFLWKGTHTVMKLNRMEAPIFEND